MIVWRRCGQTLTIGEEVEIEILEARAHRVKLGVVAPATISIVRGEARITREENLAAALSAGRGMIDTLLRGLPSRPAGTQASGAASGIRATSEIRTTSGVMATSGVKQLTAAERQKTVERL